MFLKNKNAELELSIIRSTISKLSDYAITTRETLGSASFIQSLGIRAKMYQPRNNNVGQAYLLDGQPVILVSENEPSDKQRLIAYHELGHLTLGHVGTWGSFQNRNYLPRIEQEREAMIFATEMAQTVNRLQASSTRQAVIAHA